MRYNLALLARRAGKRKRLTVFAPITITKAQTDGLAKLHRRILAPWLNARERITEVYAAELARVLQTDSIDDIARLFAELGEEVQRLVLELTPAMRDWAFSVESIHRSRWRRTVLAGADVDVGYLIGPAEAQEPISQFLARNTALVRDTSTQVQGRISDAVFRGLQARTPAREVGKQIAEATGLARRRADRVAADQGVKLASALDAQRQREAGLTVWKWNHSGKLHPRPEHQKRDGNLYADDPEDRGTLANGDVVAEPPADRPGELPFCGCVRQAVLVYEGAVL